MSDDSFDSRHRKYCQRAARSYLDRSTSLSASDDNSEAVDFSNESGHSSSSLHSFRPRASSRPGHASRQARERHSSPRQERGQPPKRKATAPKKDCRESCRRPRAPRTTPAPLPQPCAKLCTANAKPCTANASPYAANASPYAANASPYAANASPYAANASPYAANASPYTANASPLPSNYGNHSMCSSFLMCPTAPQSLRSQYPGELPAHECAAKGCWQSFAPPPQPWAFPTPNQCPLCQPCPMCFRRNDGRNHGPNDGHPLMNPYLLEALWQRLLRRRKKSRRHNHQAWRSALLKDESELDDSAFWPAPAAVAQSSYLVGDTSDELRTIDPASASSSASALSSVDVLLARAKRSKRKWKRTVTKQKAAALKKKWRLLLERASDRASDRATGRATGPASDRASDRASRRAGASSGEVGLLVLRACSLIPRYGRGPRGQRLARRRPGARPAPNPAALPAVCRRLCGAGPQPRVGRDSRRRAQRAALDKLGSVQPRHESRNRRDSPNGQPPGEPASTPARNGAANRRLARAVQSAPPGTDSGQGHGLENHVCLERPPTEPPYSHPADAEVVPLV